MSEIAKCPVCGEEPRVDDVDAPYYSYHCCGHAVFADDGTSWNQYATLRAETERLKGEVERLKEAARALLDDLDKHATGSMGDTQDALAALVINS